MEDLIQLGTNLIIDRGADLKKLIEAMLDERYVASLAANI